MGDEKQAKFRSQVTGQAQCVFMSTASVYLVRKWSRKHRARVAPKPGERWANHRIAFLSLCAKLTSAILRWESVDAGCTVGLSEASALPRALSWWSGPHLACPVSPAVAVALTPVLTSGQGRSGQPSILEGPSCFLSFSKKHKTLEIRVAYDRLKKAPNDPQKRQYILHCVKC